MTSNDLYNIRMRASNRGKHVSGAEKIVSKEAINLSLSELTMRAMNRSTLPDEIVIKIEDIGTRPIQRLKALDVTTINVSDVDSGRLCAAHVLGIAGVSSAAVKAAIENLTKGPSASCENMRGAMLMNAKTGERLEQDRERGVRATRFDWTGPAGKEIDNLLAGVGLVHFRTREALALATKIAHGPGVAAELCWSDDQHYTAGYVASLKTGYVRFPFLKEDSNPHGGRAIFVNNEMTDIDALIHYLQKTITMIDKTGTCRKAVDSVEYFDSLNK